MAFLLELVLPLPMFLAFSLFPKNFLSLHIFMYKFIIFKHLKVITLIYINALTMS